MKKNIIIGFVFLLIIQTLSFGQSQERIITAGSVITETVCLLGDCDKIIATDRTSLYPAEVQKLPSIGYRSGINAEGIISLKPTLVIAEKDYVDESVIRQLSATGIKLLIIDRKLDFNDTKKLITQIASTLGREGEGEKLISKNEKALNEVKSLLQTATYSPKVLCIYNRGMGTISVAGRNTFAEILGYVGATNAFQSVDNYKPVNTETIIAANPDYLLMLSTGFESIGGIEGALKIPGIAQTTAGKKRQVIAIESLKLTNFGPRFGEAVKELVMLVHPELQNK